MFSSRASTTRLPCAVAARPLIWVSVELDSVHTAVPAVFGPRLASVPELAPVVGVGSTANAALGSPPMMAVVVTATTAAPSSRGDALENREA